MKHAPLFIVVVTLLLNTLPCKADQASLRTFVVEALGKAGPNNGRSQDDLTVQTTNGPIEGFRSPTNFNAFLGIPYAQAGRWETPVDPSSWKQVLETKSYGPICSQTVVPVSTLLDNLLMTEQPWNRHSQPTEDQSEDCLFVNVYAPIKAKKIPVMVWIYGGGLNFGSGSDTQYNPEHFMEKGNVVLVTLNYRLGPFGYFAHPDLDETNFGLYDQIKALEWVRDNIEGFGGDPGRVTIFGESSGATSVGALLVSPLTEGLFARAIMESMPIGGGGSSTNATMKKYSQDGVAFGETLKISKGPDQLLKMKNLSVEQLLPSHYTPRIVIDDKSMVVGALTGFLTGTNHKVPLIIGTNDNEGAIYPAIGMSVAPMDLTCLGASPSFGQYLPTNTTENFEGFVRAAYGSKAKDVLSFYPSDTPKKSSNGMLTDNFYTTGTLMIAEAMAARDEEIRLYHFTQKPYGKAGEEMGAFHGFEYPYVFGSYAQSKNPDAPAFLGDYMRAYWTNFAATGDPNERHLPKWPKFSENPEKWFLIPKFGQAQVPKEKLDLFRNQVLYGYNEGADCGPPFF